MTGTQLSTLHTHRLTEDSPKHVQEVLPHAKQEPKSWLVQDHTARKKLGARIQRGDRLTLKTVFPTPRIDTGLSFHWGY